MYHNVLKYVTKPQSKKCERYLMTIIIAAIIAVNRYSHFEAVYIIFNYTIYRFGLCFYDGIIICR